MGYIGKVPADVLIDPMVDSAAITDATIVTADIANDAVTSAKLAANSVDSSELIDGSVDNSHLAGSIAINKTLLAGGTGLTLSTNTLNVDAAQTQITSVGTIGTGVWQGTPITAAYLNAAQTQITSVGTLTGLTLSGAIVGSNGSASAPSHSFSANTDSGMYSPADNQLAFASGGTQALIFGGDQSATFAGDVQTGILHVPEYIKHVGDADTHFRFSAANNIEITAGSHKLMRFEGNAQEVVINEDQTDIDFRVETADASHTLFCEGSTNRVGMGTSSPKNDALEIAFDDGSNVYEQSNIKANAASGILINNTGSSVGRGGVLHFTSKDGDNNTAIVHTQEADTSASLRFFTESGGTLAEALLIDHDGVCKFAGAIKSTITGGHVQIDNGQGTTVSETMAAKSHAWQNIYNVLSAGAVSIGSDSSNTSHMWWNCYDTGSKYNVSSGYGMDMYHSKSGGEWVVRMGATNTSTAGDAQSLVNKLHLNKDGKLGIGTNLTPTKLLHLYGDSGVSNEALIYFETGNDGHDGWQMGADDDSFRLNKTGTSTIFLVNPDTSINWYSSSSIFSGNVTSKSNAKFWIRYDAYDNEGVGDSYNYSSMTDHSTGDYQFNFSTNMPSNQYCLVASGHYGGGENDAGNVGWLGSNLLVGSCRVYFNSAINNGTSFSTYDPEELMVLIFDN